MGEGRSAEGAFGGNPAETVGSVIAAPETSVGAVPTQVTPAPPAAAPPSFDTFVPADMRDKPWAKDLLATQNPWETIVKNYANAQEYLGKKEVFTPPDPTTATPEQIKDFHKALGVPETVDKYTYTPPDVKELPELVQQAWQKNLDPAFTKAVQEKAYELGITQKQFDGLASIVDAAALSNIQAIVKSTQDFEANRKSVLTSIYGDQTDYVERIARETALKVLPENVRNTKDLNIALHAAMKFIHENNYKNDSIANPASSAATAQDPANLQAAIFAERSEVDANTKKRIYDDPFHPGYQAKHMRVDAMYKELAKAKIQ